MIGCWRWSACAVVCLLLANLVTSVPVTSTTSIVVTPSSTEGTESTSSSSTTTTTTTTSTTSDSSPSSTTPSPTVTASGQSSPVSAANSEWPSTVQPSNDVRYKPKITSMHVESKVALRYAKTQVTSKVANPDTKANEVTFSVVIPETAFITAFSMEIDGKVYDAYVKEKDEAKKEYDTAVSGGFAAAHVAVKARDSNHFTVSVNVEPQKKAIFRLYYEELLTRRLQLYNLIMNLSPGQLVDDFKVDVEIKENAPITELYVPGLRTGNEIDADPNDAPNKYAQRTISEDKLTATVHFSPSKAQQLELMKLFKEREKETMTPQSVYAYEPKVPAPNDEDGLKGQFVVQYDVDRTLHNEVMLNDGYFVYFFAPKDLEPLNKHVIFVLDVSGSMIGRKVKQLQEAMMSILDDLNPGDYITIMDFSYNAKVYKLDEPSKRYIVKSQSSSYMYPWDDYDNTDPSQNLQQLPPPYPATKENIQKAKEIIKGLSAGGGTNINDALTTALQIANTGIQMNNMMPEGEMAEDKRVPEPMVIFLTDGDPTVGETSPDKILSAVKESNPKKVAIFSLAFGEDADRTFLRRVALQNSGFLRHIYEAADAALQLKHFYKLVASPLLSNITFTYPKEQILESALTKKTFNHYFAGSELVLAGKIANQEVPLNDIPLKLHAKAFSGPIDFIPIVPIEVKRKDFWPLERMWAYIKVRQLLDEKDELGGNAEDLKDPDSPAKKALDLALKYSFVTPLTSLVVVKPNATSAVDAESVDASGTDRGYALPLIASGASGYSSLHLNSASPGLYYSHARLSSRPAAPFGWQTSSSSRIMYQVPRFGSSPMANHRPASSHMTSRMSLQSPQVQSYNSWPTANSVSRVMAGPMFAQPTPVPRYKLTNSGRVPSVYGRVLNRMPISPMRASIDSAPTFGLGLAALPGPSPQLLYNKKFLTTTTMLPARRAAGFHPYHPTTTYRPYVPVLQKESAVIAESDVAESDVAESDVAADLMDHQETAENVTSTVAPLEKLRAYGLAEYKWLEQYLNSDNDTVVLPLPNSEDKLSYKLLRSDAPAPAHGANCTNSVEGGDGVCVYLTACQDLSKGFRDLDTYLTHHCHLQGIAGICCKIVVDP